MEPQLGSTIPQCFYEGPEREENQTGCQAKYKSSGGEVKEHITVDSLSMLITPTSFTMIGYILSQFLNRRQVKRKTSTTEFATLRVAKG